MRKLLFGSIMALCLTGPAIAQYAPPPPPGGWHQQNAPWDPSRFWAGAPPGARERIEFLQNRINLDASKGRLNPDEYRIANNGLTDIRHLVHDMHQMDGHLSRSDNDLIQQRLDRLTAHVHEMAHNDW